MIGSKAVSNDGRPWAWSKDIYTCWWPTPSLSMTTTANMWRSSISFRPEKPIERKADGMKQKDADTVRFALDPGNLPPLPEAPQAALAVLPAKPEERKSVVWGKSVTGRGDLGGSSNIKKKKHMKK